ncbi:MAG: helix-turn-helix transcriptional regulator [Lachnospiraceae bacterium]|nr:helix-turn-helix transcriptional regulator [Lachnospiraceae bacterium]
MYTNNAYLNNTTLDIKDKSKPLIVTSCGTYRLYTKPKLPTWRPRGRLDFQLLYIAAGKAHFHFDGKEQIVTAGHMVLYRPKDPQKYEYYGEDQTEDYRVHFTGGNVTNILRSYGLTDDKRVFYCGSGLDYQNLFRTMINELQMCKENYAEMLEMYLRQIFIMLQRYFVNSLKTDNAHVVEEIDKATLYFNEHYSEDISIDEYAQNNHVSVSWFIRNFKHCTGSTPMQYILSKRIYNAEILLHNSSYNVTEIAQIVGYDNPLYFSRIFKKIKGLSPSEYRNNINS